MKHISGILMVATLSITLTGCWWYADERTPLEFSSTPPETAIVGQEYRYDIKVIPETERGYEITVSGQPDWLELKTEEALPVNVGNITGNITYMAADGEDIYFYGTSLSDAGNALDNGVYKIQLDSDDAPVLVHKVAQDVKIGGMVANSRALYLAELKGALFSATTDFIKYDLTAETLTPELIKNVPGHALSIAANGSTVTWSDGGPYLKSVAPWYPGIYNFNYHIQASSFTTIGLDAYSEYQYAMLGKFNGKVYSQNQANMFDDVPSYKLLPQEATGYGAAYNISGSGCITGITAKANLGTYFASNTCYVLGEQKPGNLRFVPVDGPTTRVQDSLKTWYEPGEIIYGSTTAVTLTASGRVVWASEAERTLKTFTMQQNTLVGIPTAVGEYEIRLSLESGESQTFPLTVTDPFATYAVTGTVYGLHGAIQISNNDNDTLTISTAEESSSNFSFTKRLKPGEEFAVDVLANPTGQSCSIRDEDGASGVMDDKDVEVIVDCDYITYSIGGTVSGLKGELVLSLNSDQGDQDLLIDENGTFSFDGDFIFGDKFSVAIKSQPYAEECEINTSFTDQNGDETTPVVSGPVDVQITCTTDDTPRTLSVTVSGLPEAATIEMGAVGPEDGRWEFEEKAFANGTGTFTNTLLDSEAFSIAILMPPIDYLCNITGESPLYGTTDGEGLVDGNVSISVSCEQDPATIPRTMSVTVTGLPEGSAVTMLAKGPVDNRWTEETKAFSSGTASFDNTLLDGEVFDISKTLDPDGYSCSITGETPLDGAMDGVGIVDGNVTITVSCDAIAVSPPRTLSVTVTGLPADGTTVAMRAFGPDDGRWLQENKAFGTGTAAFNNTMLDGETFDIRKLADPTGYSCTITDEAPLDGAADGYGAVDGDVTITVTCSI